MTTQHAHERNTWGDIEWCVSRALANSDELTVGWCTINPGHANALHLHPNCEEVLIVIRGQIIHTKNGEEIPMAEGDMIVLPRGTPHNARNVSDQPARLLICFSSADRQVVSAEAVDLSLPRPQPITEFK